MNARKKFKRLVIGLVAGSLCLTMISCVSSGSGSSNQLLVFHAGSLSLPLKKMAEQFMELHPGTEVLLEATGSVAAVRKLTDLGRKCDIMALADARLIDEWLIPEFAEWNLHFASNEIALVYTDKSKYKEELNGQNWYDIIMRPDVAYGRSDPNADPCGYRTVLCLKLADIFYPAGVDYDAILDKDNRYIRPKETDLLALLEVGALDYIFLYSSVAIQHGYNLFRLPDSINLSNPDLGAYYSRVSTRINGKVPGEMVTVTGDPMVYGVTIPKNAPNRGLATEFIRFLADEDGGLKILEESGQTLLKVSFSEKGSKPDILDQ